MGAARGLLMALSLLNSALGQTQAGQGLEPQQMTPSLLRVLPSLDLLDEAGVRDRLERGDVSVRVDGKGGYTFLDCLKLHALFSNRTGELIAVLPSTSDNPPIEPELTRDQYVAKANRLLA